MNLFAAEVLELKKVAGTLMILLVQAREYERLEKERKPTSKAQKLEILEASWAIVLGPRRPLILSSEPSSVQELRAVVEVLRFFIRGEKLGALDIRDFLQALNGRVLNLFLDYYEGDPHREYLKAHAQPWRHAAQEVLTFIEYFAAEPRLKKFNPIGLCPRCDSLFFRHKLGQGFCSPKCRTDSWRESTKKEDPEYWARKARESRSNRRRVLKLKSKKSETKKQRRPRRG